MDAHGVEVLDGADDLHVIVHITHHFEFELLPTQDAFFDEQLLGGREIQAALADGLELFNVVGDASAAAPHRERRSDDGRKPSPLQQLPGLIHGVCKAPAAGLQAQFVHQRLEDFPVLSAHDGRGLRPDEFHAVLLQNTTLMRFHGQVQCRLAAHRRKNRVRLFGLDDFFEHRQREWLDVGCIRPRWVRHDAGGVGIQQDRADAFFAKGLQGLRSRVVKLTGLPDLDGAATKDEDAF